MIAVRLRESLQDLKTKQNKNKNLHLLTNKLEEDEKDYNKLKRFIIQLQ